MGRRGHLGASNKGGDELLGLFCHLNRAQIWVEIGRSCARLIFDLYFSLHLKVTNFSENYSDLMTTHWTYVDRPQSIF